MTEPSMMDHSAQVKPGKIMEANNMASEGQVNGILPNNQLMSAIQLNMLDVANKSNSENETPKA